MCCFHAPTTQRSTCSSGGAGASAGGSSVTINHLSAGRIPGGGQVERAIPTPLLVGETLDLGLNAADFQTARQVAQAINQAKGAGTARALDGRRVRVKAPADADERISFLADIEELPLQGSSPAAKVVVNSRTGSIVVNQAVSLGACAVAHGNLSVSISSTPVVSQPNPLSGGQTVQAEKADISIAKDKGELINVEAAPKLADVVRALNALGATPQEILTRLQNGDYRDADIAHDAQRAASDGMRRTVTPRAALSGLCA